MFKKHFIFYLLLTLLLACNQSTPSRSLVETRIQDTISTAQHQDSTNLVEQNEAEEALNERDLTRSIGESFIGYIDDQYAIELFFQRTKSSHLHQQDISGSYQYQSTQSPIQLDGKIYTDQQKIVLSHQKKELEDERFEGTYTPDWSVIKGTWTKVRKNQQLNFELQNLMNKENTALFLKALSSTLGEDAEAPSVEDIGLDEKGIYLQNLRGRHLDYSFSPGYFSADAWYSSTARNSDYKTTVYLKKVVFKNQYVAVVKEYHSTEYFEQGKDGDEAPEVTTTINYSVWMPINDKIVNIFVDETPNPQSSIYAILKGKQLMIIDQFSKKEQQI